MGSRSPHTLRVLTGFRGADPELGLQDELVLNRRGWGGGGCVAACGEGRWAVRAAPEEGWGYCSCRARKGPALDFLREEDAGRSEALAPPGRDPGGDWSARSHARPGRERRGGTGSSSEHDEALPEPLLSHTG